MPKTWGNDDARMSAIGGDFMDLMGDVVTHGMEERKKWKEELCNSTKKDMEWGISEKVLEWMGRMVWEILGMNVEHIRSFFTSPLVSSVVGVGKECREDDGLMARYPLNHITIGASTQQGWLMVKMGVHQDCLELVGNSTTCFRDSSACCIRELLRRIAPSPDMSSSHPHAHAHAHPRCLLHSPLSHLLMAGMGWIG